ncbi:hypothetical protein ZIOFF_022188 [Zingiber officinale]|uniref:RING-type domain-containing protein n=1 Tax=Zingiber officinale TaxID=94328 RepID=A0A8J5HBL0_ZINOF|nr:hypothetical protein ZIOFF_022188 [Zingiber officinale]
MPSPSDVVAATTNNTWGPYTSGKDFGVNMATVLVVLLGATALAFALHVAYRFLVRLLGGRNLGRDRAGATHDAGGGDQDDKPTAAAQLSGPVVSFSSGATRVAGAPECAICLAELEEGDLVRVLPPSCISCEAESSLKHFVECSRHGSSERKWNGRNGRSSTGTPHTIPKFRRCPSLPWDAATVDAEAFFIPISSPSRDAESLSSPLARTATETISSSPLIVEDGSAAELSELSFLARAAFDQEQGGIILSHAAQPRGTNRRHKRLLQELQSSLHCRDAIHIPMSEMPEGRTEQQEGQQGRTLADLGGITTIRALKDYSLVIHNSGNPVLVVNSSSHVSPVVTLDLDEILRRRPSLPWDVATVDAEAFFILISSPSRDAKSLSSPLARTATETISSSPLIVEDGSAAELSELSFLARAAFDQEQGGIILSRAAQPRGTNWRHKRLSQELQSSLRCRDAIHIPMSEMPEGRTEQQEGQQGRTLADLGGVATIRALKDYSLVIHNSGDPVSVVNSYSHVSPVVTLDLDEILR